MSRTTFGRTNGPRGGRGGAALALALLIACLVPSPPAAVAAPPPGLRGAATWRVPERDAVNCLYFLLRFHHRAVSYDRVLAAFPGGGHRASLSEIQAAARRLGSDCGIYRCGLADLPPLNQPAVVYIEAAGLQTGSFCVLLNASDPDDRDGLAVLLSGGLATIRQVPLDDFRRQWGGYLLMVRPRAAVGRSRGPRLAALGAAAVIGACLLASRLRRPRAPAVAEPDLSATVDHGANHGS